MAWLITDGCVGTSGQNAIARERRERERARQRPVMLMVHMDNGMGGFAN